MRRYAEWKILSHNLLYTKNVDDSSQFLRYI